MTDQEEKPKAKTKEKYKYCFPNIMAKMMKKVDMRTQMEASLMSMFLIMIGMILMAAYLVIYGDQGWFFKGLLIFNLVCGFAFITSYLITTYQQYVNHMMIMGIDPDADRVEVKKKGNIFKRIQLAIRTKRMKKDGEENKLEIDEAIEKFNDDVEIDAEDDTEDSINNNVLGTDERRLNNDGEK